MSSVLIVSEQTACAETLQRSLDGTVATSAPSDVEAALCERDWSMVVGIFPMPDAGSAESVFEDLDSLCTAVVSQRSRVRRLALVSFICRADDLDGSNFWLGDRIRRRSQLAVIAGEELGVGVTLIRYLSDQGIKGDPQWTDDVARALHFIDTAAPYVAVPELELAR